MNPSESPSEESSLNRDATWRTGGDEGVEIGRETVKFAGTETVNVCRHVNTSVVAEGEVSEGGPTDKPVAVRPLAGPREIPVVCVRSAASRPLFMAASRAIFCTRWCWPRSAVAGSKSFAKDVDTGLCLVPLRSSRIERGATSPPVLSNSLDGVLSNQNLRLRYDSVANAARAKRGDAKPRITRRRSSPGYPGGFADARTRRTPVRGRPRAAPPGNPATGVDVAHPSIDAAGSVFRTSGPTDREKEAFALLRTLWNDIEAFERLVQPDRHPLMPSSGSRRRRGSRSSGNTTKRVCEVDWARSSAAERPDAASKPSAGQNRAEPAEALVPAMGY